MAEFRLTGVPQNLVAKRTRSYERDGAIVRVETESGGAFTLIVTYPRTAIFLSTEMSLTD
jgi:hypothetical protein